MTKLVFGTPVKVELTTGQRTMWTSDNGLYRVSLFSGNGGYAKYYRAEWYDKMLNPDHIKTINPIGIYPHKPIWDLCEFVRFKSKARAMASCEKHSRNCN